MSKTSRKRKRYTNELVRAEAANFPVVVLCKLVGVSASGYYAWRRHLRSRREDNALRLIAKIRAIHARTRGVYGSRRITQELDEAVGRNRVARLMRDHSLQALWKKLLCMGQPRSAPPVANLNEMA